MALQQLAILNSFLIMKKILVFLALSLFIFGNSYANDSRINEFVDWLYKNGHTQYVKEVDICKEYKKY